MYGVFVVVVHNHYTLHLWQEPCKLNCQQGWDRLNHQLSLSLQLMTIMSLRHSRTNRLDMFVLRCGENTCMSTGHVCVGLPYDQPTNPHPTPVDIFWSCFLDVHVKSLISSYLHDWRQSPIIVVKVWSQSNGKVSAIHDAMVLPPKRPCLRCKQFDEELPPEGDLPGECTHWINAEASHNCHHALASVVTVLAATIRPLLPAACYIHTLVSRQILCS